MHILKKGLVSFCVASAVAFISLSCDAINPGSSTGNSAQQSCSGDSTYDSLTGTCTAAMPQLVCPNNKTFEHLSVVKPNGGEIFKIGDTIDIELKAESELEAQAIALFLVTDEGLNEVEVIGGSIDPFNQSTYSFVLQASYTVGDAQFSSVSDKCVIKAISYADHEDYDESDCYLKITQ